MYRHHSPYNGDDECLKQTPQNKIATSNPTNAVYKKNQNKRSPKKFMTSLFNVNFFLS
jgi:hypothetical protein